METKKRLLSPCIVLLFLFSLQCETGIFKPVEPIPQGGFQGIIKAGSLGGAFYAVVKPDHSLWTWGNNDYGSLGNGTTISNESPTQVPNINNVVAMDIFNCSFLAADSAGDIWYWGHPIIFWTENVLTPTKISHIDNVSDLFIEGGGACILDKNGNIWYLGFQYPNDEPLSEWIEPQLIETIPDASEIAEYIALTENGTAIGYGGHGGPERGGLNDALNNVACVSNDLGFHAVIAKKDGTVWQWGRVQDADGTWQSRIDPVQVAGLPNIISVDVCMNTNVALASDGTAWYWGKHNPVPEKISGLRNVTIVEIGPSEKYFFKCADGSYWTWNREQNELKPVMTD